MINFEGQTWGDCEILARLGEGSVGLVYKARQRPPGRLVVFHVLDPRWVKEAGYLSRFKRDAAMVATLHHPNLVQLHSTGEHKGTHYVVTEFVEGETLRDQLQRRGRLGAREALAIAYYVARALLHGWTKLKLAHLDVRPENIFVLPSADVKLGDLGIAKPPVGSRAWLPYYTAPEQAAGGGVDFHADIYSVGCVLYHMLAGKPPCEGHDAKALLAQQAGDPPPAVTKSWPACPASLERLLGKMMAKRPGDRFRSYDDLIQELLQVRDEVKRAAQPHAAVQASGGSRHFAGYTLLGKLGQDDVGVDYEAFEPAAHRIVLLRVLAQRFSRVPGFADRFKRGMAAVMRLSHDNIRPLVAAGEADGACYIASEFIEGRTLRQRLERRGQLQPREALAIAVYVAQALQHAWNSARMTHGAISSDNVVLVRGGTVKVGDFGLEKILGTETGAADQTGPPRCSSHYMSPEQARGLTELDCRADIYGLGCLLYHMLTGRTPYTGDHSAAIVAKHNSEPPPSILKAWPGCPSSLAGLMDRMLAKSRSGRPQTYEELLAELVKVREEFRRVQVVTPPPPGKTPAVMPGEDGEEPAADEAGAKPSGRNWKPMWVGAGIGLVFVFGGLLVWAPWKRTAEPASSPEAWPSEFSRPRVVPLSETVEPRREAGPVSRRPETAAAYKAPVSRPVPPPAKTEKKTIAPIRRPPAAETAAAKAPDTSSATDRLMAPHAAMAKAGSEIIMDATSGAVSKGKPMTDEAFAGSIPPLPPQEQIRRVIARLQELNPGFDGKANYRIEGGVVTEVAISTTGTLVPTVGVSDLVPLKSLKGLQRLVLAPAKPDEPGALSDLSALTGMRLTWLYCHGNPQLHDLSPLRDMPLTGLSCGGSQVKDLSPLSGMRLTTLAINDTPVEDISVLSGMPLAVLWCNNTKLTGLSVLKGMPLRELRCDFVRTRDEAVLRGIPTLARINDLPVAAFWKNAQTATAVPAATSSRALRTAADFKSLFNGKDMNLWRPRSISAPNGWRVRRSSMINTPPSNDLESKDKFQNFEFYCEYQLARQGNSGVLLRGAYRIPLQNDAGYPPTKNSSGSVAGLIAPAKNAAKPAETWQALYVKLSGDTVTVILNNKKVINARNLHESTGSVEVAEVNAGPLVLQGHGGVTFRNLRIKELPAE